MRELQQRLNLQTQLALAQAQVQAQQQGGMGGMGMGSLMQQQAMLHELGQLGQVRSSASFAVHTACSLRCALSAGGGWGGVGPWAFQAKRSA